MPFAYYNRLTRGQQRVYRQSDDWMRTARRHQAVRFRTFLRTLLHELRHQLDYELLALPDSFHTEGFYKRESSLLRQLVPSAEGAEAP